MNRSAIGKLCDIVKGAHVMGAAPLGDYHAARKARDAAKLLKHRTPEDRLRGVKAALKNYRVTVRLDGTRLIVRNNESGTEVTL